MGLWKAGTIAVRKRYLGTLAYALAFTMLISTAVSAAVTTVEFADPNLRAAVSQAVGGRLGLLWAKDVQDLTVLNADLRGVFSLDGIEQLAELKRISLIGNKVACIEPLLALKNLEFVDLRFNDSLDVSVGSSAERVIATLTERGCQVYWGVTAMCVEYTPYGGSSSLLTECDGELPGIWPLIWASVTDQSQSCHLTASEQAITLHVAEIRQPHPPLGGVFRLCPKEGVPPLDAEWEAVKNAGPWTVAAGTKGIVVLVHGWSSNHERLTPYARELGGEWTVYGFDYARDQRISDTGAALASLLDRRVPPGQKVHIVAHSMGGLVARSAIEQHGAAAHVDTLITLGTPHSGMPIEYILNGHELYLQALAFYDSRVEDPGASNVTRLASRMGRDLFVSETAHRKPFGLDVLDMCGLTSFLADLNAESPVGTVYYQIAGDRHPSLGKRERGFVDVMGELSGWFAHSIYDLQLPDEKPTDGVVPLRSALLDLSGEQIDGMHLVWDQERTFTFPVDHGSFYKSPEAMALMKRILGGGEDM